MAVREGHKLIFLEEIKDALAQEIRDDADVIPKVEAVPQVDALVSVLPVIRGQGREHPQLYARGVTILLHGANDLDGTSGPFSPVVRLDYLSKSTLA